MINAYCVDEITIWLSGGNDSWGEPLSGTLIDVKGYVEWKTRLIRNWKGEEVVSTIRVLLPKRLDRPAWLGRALTHEDKIQIGGESFERAIIDVRTPKDFAKNTSLFGPHYEIYLA